jgi:hypothetical protein
MKKYLFRIAKLICFSFILGICSSCNLMGLDLQQDYKYTHTPINLNLNITAYQFIESRKNIDMSFLYEAIQKVGCRDSFEVKNRTYIILNDVAFSAYLTSKKYAGINSMTNIELGKLLNQYIIIGQYPASSLSIVPLTVTSSDKTELQLYLNDAKIDDANKGLVKVNLMGSTTVRSIVTSNIMTTNGVMHVTDYYLN